jgi:hypothetical protein
VLPPIIWMHLPTQVLGGLTTIEHPMQELGAFDVVHVSFPYFWWYWLGQRNNYMPGPSPWVRCSRVVTTGGNP